MLSVDRLRVLHAVANQGSVSGATAMLHVTTSAVSQQIAKLERETGERLLEPNGRRVRLTDAAELLVAHASRILSLVEEAESELDSHRDAVVGRLSFAAFATAARGLAPAAVRRLLDRYPRLLVTLSELEPDAAIPLVSRGDLDLAVVQDWFNAPLALSDGLMRRPLLDDVVDVALPLEHPLARRGRVIELDELAGQPWISWTPGAVCHDWLLLTLRERGVEPKVVHTAGEHQTQLALVAAGLGAAVIPRLGRGRIPDGVEMVAVRPALSRHVYAVWRATAAKRRAIDAALDALTNAAEQATDGARGHQSLSSSKA